MNDTHLKKITKLLQFLSLAVLCLSSSLFAKILYVTHEPGTYHDYTNQKKLFIKLAEKEGWEYDIFSGSAQEVEKKLAENPTFAKGYDLIIYNMCMAHSSEMRAPYNMIAQTEKLGIPAIAIHCTMHTFWKTHRKESANTLKVKSAEVIVDVEKGVYEKWLKLHKDTKPFPFWHDFLGLGSKGHGGQEIVYLNAVNKKHPVAGKLEKDAHDDQITEQYFHYHISKLTEPIATGFQKKQNLYNIVLWETPRGHSRVLGFTLGHNTREWEMPVFTGLIVEMVNYLTELNKPTKKGYLFTNYPLAYFASSEGASYQKTGNRLKIGSKVEDSVQASKVFTIDKYNLTANLVSTAGVQKPEEAIFFSKHSHQDFKASFYLNMSTNATASFLFGQSVRSHNAPKSYEKELRGLQLQFTRKDIKNNQTEITLYNSITNKLITKKIVTLTPKTKITVYVKNNKVKVRLSSFNKSKTFSRLFKANITIPKGFIGFKVAGKDAKVSWEKIQLQPTKK